MRRSLHDAWWRLVTTSPHSASEILATRLLDGGAWLYGLGVAARNAAYDRGWAGTVRLGCPVISVGNLSVGGTGKTACVEYLARRLAGAGRRVAVLSRGYGGRGQDGRWLEQRHGQLVIDGQPDASITDLPDEPQLLARHVPGVPIVLGRRREQTGRLACGTLRADTLVLDDAFQYRRLARDCEIVLINARMPLGGWPLLPRGPLREPLSSLRRADVIIITKADHSMGLVAALQERLRAINGRRAIMATAIHEPAGLHDLAGTAVPLDRLRQARVALLSSIGDPEGFEQTVVELGATMASHQAFPDHHPYRLHDWQQVVGAAHAAGAEALVTTEKDLIRLQPLLGRPAERSMPVWVLRIQLKLISGEEALDARLRAVCAR